MREALRGLLKQASKASEFLRSEGPQLIDTLAEKYVNETVTKKVPYQTCRWVKEEHVRTVPVATCKMVQETKTCQVPYQVCKQVPYTVTQRVARCVPKQVPVTYTQCVARTVPKQVAYEVCRMVPVTVCDATPSNCSSCGVAAPVGETPTEVQGHKAAKPVIEPAPEKQEELPSTEPAPGPKA